MRPPPPSTLTLVISVSRWHKTHSMPFCPLSPMLPASKSANKSPRICYECSLSPSCRADARGVLIRGKLGRAHARSLTAKSRKTPRPPRRKKTCLVTFGLQPATSACGRKQAASRCAADLPNPPATSEHLQELDEIFLLPIGERALAVQPGPEVMPAIDYIIRAGAQLEQRIHELRKVRLRFELFLQAQQERDRFLRKQIQIGQQAHRRARRNRPDLERLWRRESGKKLRRRPEHGRQFRGQHPCRHGCCPRN